MAAYTQLGMVFADFTSVELATRAVIYLCNLRLGQSSIIAELAHSDSTVQSDTELHERNTGAHVGNDRKREPMAPLLGLTHEMDKDLEYVYPPATPTVVHNIAQTILAVPRLYTQVTVPLRDCTRAFPPTACFWPGVAPNEQDEPTCSIPCERYRSVASINVRTATAEGCEAIAWLGAR